MPLLCVYLFWLRYKNRPSSETSGSAWPWWILIAVAFAWPVTRVVVEANPTWRAGSWVMGVLFLATTLALLQIAGGSNWRRHFWFPVAFYLVAIPWPSQWENGIVQGLTGLNTAIVVEGLAVLGIPAVKHGNVIEISRGLVSIDEACSGIRSLQATLMIALFFGELYRLTARWRILLVACGAAVAFLCNMLRTFTLVWISSRHGNAEMAKWHDPTGVAILLGCFISLWWIGTKLQISGTTAPATPSTTGSTWEFQPQWLAPLFCVWLAAVECGNAAWFGFRDQNKPSERNWTTRWPVEKEDFRELELTPDVQAILAFDEGQSVSWRAADGSRWQAFHFSWGPARNSFDRIRVQFAKSHRPEVCLPASGMELQEHRGMKLFSARGLELPFQSFRFKDHGMPLHVYFCAWEDGPKGGVALMRESVASRLQAALAGSRSLSQRVLEVAVWGKNSNQEADEALQETLTEIIRQ